MAALFVYGSLRDRDLIQVVLGRPVDAADIEPARAPDYAAIQLTDEAYPALVPASGQCADGLVLHNLSAADLERLTFFEGAACGLASITVQTASGSGEVRYLRGTEKPSLSGKPWNFDAWRRDHRDVDLEAARECMDYMGRIPADVIDTLWPGIKIRAQQRARALGSPQSVPAHRSDFGQDDVRYLEVTRAYASYLAVQELRLDHRRFDGGWLGPLDRSVVLWGDAVTVLPYDPRCDRVLLVEQFRPGPAARGDRNPWCLEAIAGRIDTDETPEQNARREAIEEAGLTLGRIEQIAEYYASPGLAAEHLISFVAEADLDGNDGFHGLSGEAEDIRTVTLSFDQAMAASRDGSLNTAIGLVSLLWLAANRDRLRREWSGA